MISLSKTQITIQEIEQQILILWQLKTEMQLVYPVSILRRERRARGLTMKELAAQLDGFSCEQTGKPVALDENMISKWERGVHKPCLQYQQLLCQFFEKTAVELGFL